MKTKQRKLIVPILILLISLFSACEQQVTFNDEVRTYYVSSLNGKPENDGLDTDSPLQTIKQVNNLKLSPGDTVLFECDSVFRGNLVPASGSAEQPITYASYGEGQLPIIMGSASIFNAVGSLEKLDTNIYGTPCTEDVGNIIINDGEMFGVKKFELHSLTNPLDYYYDRNTGVLFIYADEQLEKLIAGEDSPYYSVELCVTKNIVDLSNKHDLVFKDLAIKNGSAHGFGGSNMHNILVSNCEISYIGGGFLRYNDDNEPVRYGNGFELFNSGHDIEVLDCEIFEIFDTALTNQGLENGGSQYNIVYRDNEIYNCGMAAYELWLKGRNTQMSNISFEDNEVYDIGYGFSTTQGREENFGLGYFIINFGSDAAISNISIKDNSFKNIYNAHDYDSLLLNLQIETPIEDDEIYKGIIDNTVSGARYSVIYSIDGEFYFVE